MVLGPAEESRTSPARLRARFPSHACMGRPIRYLPPEGSCLVEVTCRTVQGRYLLTPSNELNEIILGALGRAQELYPVGICALAFVSNHFLCAAPHKKCYGECPVMWSWRS